MKIRQGGGMAGMGRNAGRSGKGDKEAKKRKYFAKRVNWNWHPFHSVKHIFSRVHATL